ncbi:pyruvate kinase alpha/beta domain-containing protein, partial [Yersinia pestis]
AIYRGVTPVYCDPHTDGVLAATEAVKRLQDKGFLVSGDLVIVTQGDVMGTIGTTNTSRIIRVE